MCSNTGDIEEIGIPCSEFNNMPESKNYKNLKICRKCDNESVVVLQKKDPYCKPCFLEYCNHKFKATIGKAKKLKLGDKILLCYSCGAKSSAMLNMVLEALNSSKKCVFHTGVLFVDESAIISEISDEIDKTLQSISQRLYELNCPLFCSSLEMVFRNQQQITKFYWNYNSQHISSKEYKNELLKSLDNIKSLTSKLDYIECLKKQLLLDVAKSEKYTHIFIGDSATDLAIKFLSQIAVGRGSQVAHNTAFYDTQYEIPICRPMREFLNKEIVFYNHLQGVHYLTLPSLITKTDSHSSIQRLTESFVNGLQENFPSTVFTIFRTGGKIVSSCSGSPICVLCKSPRDNIEPDACSALEALSISEKVSTSLGDNSLTMDEQFNELRNLLCHGCQIILKDMNNCCLPPFVIEESTRKLSQSEMKKEIEEFLLDD